MVTMSIQDKSIQENIVRSENLDFCQTFDCSVVFVCVLGCFILLLVIVFAAVCRKWKVKKQEKKTQQCMNTVEMEFQFLGTLYESI